MTTTGTDAIRGALRSRRSALAIIAKEMGVPMESLHSFINQQSTPPTDVLQRLASYLWSDHITFDAEANLLRTKPTPTLPAGIRPPAAPVGPKLRSNNPIDYAPRPDGPQRVTSDAYRKPAGFA